MSLASPNKPHQSSALSMMQIIEALLLKNRTIVSSDVERCMELLAQQVPMTLHKYPTGKEYGTWVVPPRWDVKRALLSDGKKTLASYDDHPLFLAPYSHSFTGWVGREELLKHVRSAPATPDVFLYEFRLAMNYQRRLKEWMISLPHSLVERLDKPRYFVDIEVEISPGHLIVGESLLRGANDHTFSFLTHLCHPGQANDGLAGIAVGVELMRRIAREFPAPRYNYQLLVMPETIGSCVFLSDQKERYDSYLGSIFIEMIGIQSPLRYGVTRRGSTYLDRVMGHLLPKHDPKGSVCALREHWGNDELVFDSPGVGVPGGEIGRHPFQWYHTSGDNLEVTDPAALEQAVDLLMDLVRSLERDFIPRPRFTTPVHLTRFGLYADWEWERAQHDVNNLILQLMWSGLSAYDIAFRVGQPPEKVAAYLGRFAEHGLIDTLPLTPEYFRKVLSDG